MKTPGIRWRANKRAVLRGRSNAERMQVLLFSLFARLKPQENLCPDAWFEHRSNSNSSCPRVYCQIVRASTMGETSKGERGLKKEKERDE